MEQETTKPRKRLLVLSVVLLVIFQISKGITGVDAKELQDQIIPMLLGFVWVFIIVPYWLYIVWNNIIPSICSVKEIDYWQALGIMVIVSLISGLV